MRACSQKNSPVWRRRSKGLPVHGSSAYCLRAAKWQTDVGKAGDRQGWHWISPLPHCPNQLSLPGAQEFRETTCLPFSSQILSRAPGPCQCLSNISPLPHLIPKQFPLASILEKRGGWALPPSPRVGWNPEGRWPEVAALRWPRGETRLPSPGRRDCAFSSQGGRGPTAWRSPPACSPPAVKASPGSS